MNISFTGARARLEQRRSDLLRRTRRVEQDLHRTEGPLSPDFSEQATEVQNDDTLAAIGRAAEAEVAEIDEALKRIDDGKYGLCKVCGRQIDRRRLAALPQSVRCATCWA
jgi:RNA polymerase-binding transcription factor DksA